MSVKGYVKAFIPPIALSIMNIARTRGKYGFSGNFKCWGDALQKSMGYDALQILERVKDATLKVRSGEAVYERDSVLFDKISYSWPMLAGLLRVASSHDGCLGILDFGGSLGSSYFQNKSFLSLLKQVRWCVVEQPSFVDAGKALCQNDELVFYPTINECMNHEHLNVVLLSGVLQYLEDPHARLEDILSLGIDTVIVDRTPFLLNTDRDRLTVQNVPPSVYPASYPHWFFERANFLKQFLDHGYHVVAEFEGFDKANIRNSIYSGFIFEKKAQ